MAQVQDTGTGVLSTTSKSEDYALSSCGDTRTWQGGVASLRLLLMHFTMLKPNSCCGLQEKAEDLLPDKLSMSSSTTRPVVAVKECWAT
jgi:hypothetical protein